MIQGTLLVWCIKMGLGIKKSTHGVFDPDIFDPDIFMTEFGADEGIRIKNVISNMKVKIDFGEFNGCFPYQ